MFRSIYHVILIKDVRTDVSKNIVAIAYTYSISIKMGHIYSPYLYLDDRLNPRGASVRTFENRPLKFITYRM